MEQASLSEPAPEDQDFTSDAFRMASMKVLPCSKRYVHDWTECPLAHPQEKARRRDPRTHAYTGIACPSMKKEGSCAFADHCPYAHNVFEYWLHPTRYRTQLCNDGSNCRRKICFFAHSLDELRVPACKPFVSPEALAAAAAAAAAASASDAGGKRRAGVVGSPCASLALPVRLSADAVRQSAEWGPAAMPAPTRLSDGSSHSHGEEQGSPGAAPPPPPPVPAPGGFSPQEQQVIETVTSMLAHDRITPPQAATILQQMLPAASLAALQSRLGVAPEEQGPPRAAYAYGDHAAPRYSDPGLGRRGERAAFGGAYADAGRYSDGSAAAAAAFERERERVEGQGFSLEQLAAMQAAQAMGHHTGSAAAGYGPTRDYAGAGYTYPFAPGSPLSARDASARRSYESARSSMEGSRASTEFATPRGSLDSAPPAPAPPAPTQYATPAAAYPQEGRGAEGAGVSGAKAPPPPRASPAGKQQRYWTGQPLSTVPEGVALVAAPPPSNPWARRDSGSSMESAAERLSADFGRMGVGAAAPVGAERPAHWANPYASSLFNGSVGSAGAEARQGTWAPQPGGEWPERQ